MDSTTSIFTKQAQLSAHPLYAELSELTSLQIFMEHHVFAVWDFMSLLKSLQRIITCVDVPWRLSAYPAAAQRLINEIVLGEESDLGPDGNPMSHFELYLQAMDEVGAKKNQLLDFLKLHPDQGLRELTVMSAPLGNFVTFNLKLAMEADLPSLLGAFFYGREKMLPEVFEQMLRFLDPKTCPGLIYYLNRHIEIDSESHGPKALELIHILCPEVHEQERITRVALKSLELRHLLWDEVLGKIQVLKSFSALHF